MDTYNTLFVFAHHGVPVRAVGRPDDIFVGGAVVAGNVAAEVSFFHELVVECFFKLHSASKASP